ncbi:MAG: sensor histidine kinase [Candidatus Saccharibacteria bacterium]|nr:sensor histidine kinase [Candidatus Saccharibacteria bacterium]
MALSLIDNYVLSLQSLTRGDDLLMEPVSVAAVMHDAAHELSPAAKQYGIELQLDAGSRCEAVSTHRPSLQAAFVSLGHALIEALASSGATAQTPLKLAVHRNRGGVVAGLYCGREEITAEAFRRSQILHGNVRQPHVGLSAAAGTGVFVADALFQSLATKLKVSRWHHEYGLAATLPPLNQLQLV